VQTVVSASVLTLSWQPPTSGAPPSAYRLDFFASGVPVYSVTVVPVTSVQLNIPVGVQGTFTTTLTALAGGEAGPASAAVSFTIGTAPCALPPAPTGVRGMLATGIGTVSWSPVLAASGYVVLAGSAPGRSDLFNAGVGGATSVSAAGLPVGFRAYVRIIAINNCGQSVPSATVVVQ
jgi:hypothetical protein